MSGHAFWSLYPLEQQNRLIQNLSRFFDRINLFTHLKPDTQPTNSFIIDQLLTVQPIILSNSFSWISSLRLGPSPFSRIWGSKRFIYFQDHLLIVTELHYNHHHWKALNVFVNSRAARAQTRSWGERALGCAVQDATNSLRRVGKATGPSGSMY